ncbi:hypothetical protein OAF27_01885, partial [Verrucomicrobiales bacterium]|nr:hypothetical protein [Verrucomicrobiales bacterium]
MKGFFSVWMALNFVFVTFSRGQQRHVGTNGQTEKAFSGMRVPGDFSEADFAALQFDDPILRYAYGKGSAWNGAKLVA